MGGDEFRGRPHALFWSGGALERCVMPQKTCSEANLGNPSSDLQQVARTVATIGHAEAVPRDPAPWREEISFYG